MKIKILLVLVLLMIGFSCDEEPIVSVINSPNIPAQFKTIEVQVDETIINSYEQLLIGSAITPPTQIQGSKSTITTFDTTSLELVYGLNQDSSMVLMSYINPFLQNSISLDAETTSIALVMMQPWTFDLTLDAKFEAIDFIKSMSEFEELKNAVSQSILKGEPITGSISVGNSLNNVTKTIVTGKITNTNPIQFNTSFKDAITMQNVNSSASYALGIYDVNSNSMIDSKLLPGRSQVYSFFKDFLSNTQTSFDNSDIISTEIKELGNYYLVWSNGLDFGGGEQNQIALKDNAWRMLVNLSGLISFKLSEFLSKLECQGEIMNFINTTTRSGFTLTQVFHQYASKEIGGTEMTIRLLKVFSDNYHQIFKTAKSCSKYTYSLREIRIAKAAFSQMTKILNAGKVLKASNLATDLIQYDSRISECVQRVSEGFSACSGACFEFSKKTFVKVHEINYTSINSVLCQTNIRLNCCRTISFDRFSVPIEVQGGIENCENILFKASVKVTKSFDKYPNSYPVIATASAATIYAIDQPEMIIPFTLSELYKDENENYVFPFLIPICGNVVNQSYSLSIDITYGDMVNSITSSTKTFEWSGQVRCERISACNRCLVHDSFVYDLSCD